MPDLPVVLIGGTSNVGKSTVAKVLAGRLGVELVSTDKLGRHPGRPWASADRDVPALVIKHYRSLAGGVGECAPRSLAADVAADRGSSRPDRSRGWCRRAPACGPQTPPA